MATERFTGSQTDTMLGAVDLTGKEYYAAKRTAAGLDLAGAGENVDGIISEGKAVGLHSTIKTGNQLKGIAGAEVAVGAKVMSDDNGKFITATAANHVFGTAITAAGAADVLFTIEVDRSYVET